MKKEEAYFPNNLSGFKRNMFKKTSVQKVGVVLYDKDYVNIGIYLNKILYKEYKMKKKDFNYEIWLVAFSGVEMILASGCETLDEVKILEDIARENEIDLQIEMDEDLGMKLNEYNMKN